MKTRPARSFRTRKKWIEGRKAKINEFYAKLMVVHDTNDWSVKRDFEYEKSTFNSSSSKEASKCSTDPRVLTFMKNPGSG